MELGKRDSLDILQAISAEDQSVAMAVQQVLPDIAKLVSRLLSRFHAGGRLFYTGAGTSGRLGVMDASEVPPTFGMKERVIGLIAGGDAALRTSIENAEDNTQQGWIDLLPYKPTSEDTLIGIAASGETPYVLGVCKKANEHNMLTACISTTSYSSLTKVVSLPIVVDVGPEIIRGSTRMKSGTAQKMVLNMISTTLMVLLGRVNNNQMTHMQLSNEKLRKRGAKILAEKYHMSYEEALNVACKHASLPEAFHKVESQLKNS